MQRFICLNCAAAYRVTVQSEPADYEPLCEDCDSPFPDETEGGWLHYARESGPERAFKPG